MKGLEMVDSMVGKMAVDSAVRMVWKMVVSKVDRTDVDSVDYLVF